MKTIATSTFKFLKDLEKNNDRTWFNANKEIFLKEQENMASFIDELIGMMNKHDVLENESGKKSLFRIYKDVRFSKDKLPYNPRFAFSFQRATKQRRGGYYVNLKPGNTFIATGFFNPEPADLKRIREDIQINYKEWNKMLKLKGIKDNLGDLQGESLSSAPRGFEKNHPAIELIKQKQFIFRHEFSDKQVLSPDFGKELNKRFKAVRPFFDYMSEVLTTDSNGESII